MASTLTKEQEDRIGRADHLVWKGFVVCLVFERTSGGALDKPHMLNALLVAGKH